MTPPPPPDETLITMTEAFEQEERVVLYLIWGAISAIDLDGKDKINPHDNIPFNFNRAMKIINDR